jgi:acetyltransferase-like isoleucine patch superfamily enzyme
LTCVTESSANNGKAINEIPYVTNVLTETSPIIVEDEVWIGANVTILPGVKIGKCSVIGAGSVVTADVEPYSIYAGVPAKKIRCLEEGLSGKN